MSELVEKVHAAVSNVACIHTGEAVDGYCVDCRRITRAGIAAVAEWLDELDNDGRYWATVLLQQLEQPK